MTEQRNAQRTSSGPDGQNPTDRPNSAEQGMGFPRKPLLGLATFVGVRSQPCSAYHYNRCKKVGDVMDKNEGPDTPVLKVRIPHGTHGGYTYYGCRCDACRAYQTEYKRRYRATARGREKTNAAARAEGRALIRLRALAPELWSELLQEERRKEPILNDPRVEKAV